MDSNTNIAYIVSGGCGDYYCACGLGHLIAVCSTEEEAQLIIKRAENGDIFYRPGHRFYFPDITSVPLDTPSDGNYD